MVTLFVFLHIVTMFAAVAFVIGSDLFLQRAIQSRDVRTIQGTFQTVVPLARFIPVLFLIGAILGLVAAYLGYNLLQGWLIAAYVIFIVAMGLDGGVATPWRRKAGQAAAASALDKPSPELTALLNHWIARYALWIDGLLIFLIILVMVFKPFS